MPSYGGGPLFLTPPLFSWDPSAPEQGVSFDELHQRLVHRQKGGFATADLLDDGVTPDGLFVNCDLQELQSVRFSPDGLYFAFLCGARQMGVMETLHPLRAPILLPLKWNKADVEVLSFFWLPSPSRQQADFTDLAVITSQGLEIFRLSFEQHTAKSLKTVPVAVRLCWVEPITGMVLVCIGARTLQPFDLNAKNPKLPKFDLVLGRDQVLEALDVYMLPIYDATYCIHADSANSRVSLRNISNPQQGTPEHDIVVDVAFDDHPVGALRLSTVDNLLVVHCIDRGGSMLFDIRHRDRAVVPCICGPSPLGGLAAGAGDSWQWRGAGGGAADCWAAWSFLHGGTVVDPAAGHVRRLRADMNGVLQEFLGRAPVDLATVMRFLLRRTSCRELIVKALRRALAAAPNLNDWAQAFAVLNGAYRQSIELISQRGSPGHGRQTTVSLQELEAMISHQSILSENHMVSQVFHPHFMEVAAALEGRAPAACGPAAGQSADRWRIPLPARDSAGCDANGAADGGRGPAKGRYLLSAVIAYLRSLLGMQILPHKILQCFVFDICMYFQQEHTLQQLVHYHVLLDSPELVARLKDVACTRDSAWATQACLDMALRIQEFSVVADLLLHSRQYLDLVPFLMNQREQTFEVRRLLEALEGDAAAREDDPDLLEHVVTELRAWRAEASTPAPPGTEQVTPPNLEGCESWMPELVSPPASLPEVAAGAAGAGDSG